VGQGSEELGAERVEAVINAVMNKTRYTLHKWHNGEGEDADLTFDFSLCAGGGEDVVTAMVAVEKMFRCYRRENAGEDSRVLVDRKVDSFLQKSFLQYRRYCSHQSPVAGSGEYLYYTHLSEDEQYDDLTILAIKRK
jgi:hypothetical protein